MLILAVIAGLFAWSIGSGKGPDSPLYVSMLPGSLAAIAFVVTLISYFVVKRNFYQSLLINYILLTATGWLLVFTLAARGLRYHLYMVQKEAADRLTAEADTKERYPLGVTLEVMGTVERVRRVPPSCFRPRPRVDSAVIEIVLSRNFHLMEDGV